jgi:hypothetical protein
MARMIAPVAMRTTPNRYQMRKGTTATATIRSVRFRRLEIAHLHARRVLLGAIIPTAIGGLGG